MKTITLRAEDQHPLSFSDMDVRLLTYEGDLIRAIGQRKSAQYTELFGGGVAEDLIRAGYLIPSEVTELS